MKRATKILLVVAGVLGAAALAPWAVERAGPIIQVAQRWHAEKHAAPEPTGSAPPAVSVIKAVPADFTETVTVSGSLVPRDEILVAPEVEGFRVLELKVDEGDRVKKGDVLATLVQESLDAQLAQNDASLARSEAAIAQAQSQIVDAGARLKEAKSALERAEPLRKSGYLADATYDQREAAAKSAEAQLHAAQDGLKVAEAERKQVEAQRRELVWRRDNTKVTAPADGVISRRSARVGGMATVAGEPMFRIIARGEVELDAEVIETEISKISAGHKAVLDVAGAGEVTGTVRLVSPEVDKTTRLGRARIFLGDSPALRIGTFARGTVDTAKDRGLGVPTSAIAFDADGAFVQVVRDGRVARRSITTGLVSGLLVEVTKGLEEGDVVVAKAGTFLRDGDTVRPISPDAKVSEAR
jgi:RND family efflux transporter MFP subunit